MKRFISLILVIVMIISNAITLSGCATSEDEALKMGQWLALVSDSFGMENYQQEKPYFENVKADDPAFIYFQMAAEWEILEPSKEITSETVVKWNDVLISLVNAGEFLNADASDEEKIEYAIKNFDPSIKEYWGKRNIKLQEAVPLLDVAQKLWVDKEYTERIETVAYSDKVKDYSQNTEVTYVYSNDIVTVEGDELSNLQPGDVYVLPSDEFNSASINRVKTVEYVNGQVIITNDETFSEDEALEYIEDIQIQETSEMDFSNIVGIYDENGNPIVFEESDEPLVQNNVIQNGLIVNNAKDTSISRECGAVQTGIFDKVKGKLKFKVGKYTAELAITKDDFSVELSKELKSISNRYKEETTESFIKTTFNDMKLTRDVDYTYKLNSATLKLDYSTSVEGGIKIDREIEIGDYVENKDGSITSTFSDIKNQYLKALDELGKEMRNSKCDDDIYICRLSIVEGGIASVDFIVKGKVTASGELKIVVEVDGSQGIQYKNGNLRYIKSVETDVDFVAEGKLEVIIGPGIAITVLKKIDVAEITVDLGIGVSMSKTAHLFDAEGHDLYSTNVEISADVASLLANEQLFTTPEEIKALANEMGKDWDYKESDWSAGVPLQLGTCAEWKMYPIVRIVVSPDDNLVGKLLKGLKVSATCEIKGSKTPILSGHIDFPNNIANALDSDSLLGGASALLGVGASCVYKYAGWDELADKEIETEVETEIGTEVDAEDETQTDAGETEDVMISDVLSISEIRIFLEPGETHKIEIASLPKGYSLDDLVIECDNASIIAVDKQSLVIAAKEEEGTAQIIVKTNDGRYKAYCAVTVLITEDIDFEEL